MMANPPPSSDIVSYLTMRKAVGWLGMLLPFLLLIGNTIINDLNLFNNCFFVQMPDGYHYQDDIGSFKSSVSHYYYTTVGEIFTGTLCAVALFMFAYTGHPLRLGEKGLSDNAMTNLAGIFALAVVAFPTSSASPILDNLRSFTSSEHIGWIHYGSAALFFVTLAILSMVNFRRSQNQVDFGKGPDDPLYLWCGIVMIACLILVFALRNVEWLQHIHITFLLEATALIAFGLSWLKKGKADLMYVVKLVGLKKA